jgi:hypothetical protein
MGILDDAIREHLELKRKHGVPEEEVERQEEEALGPARRDVARQSEDGEIAADAVDDTSLFDGGDDDAPAAEASAVADDETAIAEPPATAEPPALEEQPAPSEEPVAAAEPTSVDAPPAESPAAEPSAAEAPPAEPPAAEPFPEESPVADPPVADHTGMEPPPDEPEPDPHAALGDTEPHGFPALDEDDEDDVHEDHARGPAPEDDDSEEDDPAAEVDDDELDVLEDTPDFLQETPEHDRLWFEQKPPRDFDFD